jgi:signal transduction histidine kinase
MFRKRLQIKIIFWVALALCVLLGTSYSINTFISLKSLNEEFEDSTRRKAVLLMEAIYNNISSTSESGHMQRLIQMTELVNAYTELKQLVIFSQDGTIRQSLNPQDVGKKISEIHYDEYLGGSGKGTAYDVGSQREFCMVRPLFNQERCFGCHDSKRRVLGILDVCLSMSSTQERIASNRAILRTIAGISALATIVVTSLAIAILVRILVNRPVSRMMGTIKTVEGGDMSARVDIKTEDELGVMGRSFNSMIETIRHLNEMKDDFISIVSHELRTPLTSIKYFAEVMLERTGKIEPERQIKYLGVINEETDRLTRLINDLLDLQKISSGKFKWKMEEVHVEQAIQSTLETFMGGAAARQVELVADVEPGIPVIVGDGDKIIQLIANLLSNAIKFTQPGKKVTVFARLGDDPELVADKHCSKHIKVGVVDEGIGISAENLEKIFEKFQQVEDSFTRQEGGTGLGLSISREIVLHHGGKIWAESAINVGSTFAFTLPVKEKPAGAHQNAVGADGEAGPREHAEAAG